MSPNWGIGSLGVTVHLFLPWLIWGDTMSVEGRVTLQRPVMIVSEAVVDIVDSPIVLSIGFLLDLVIGKDSTVHGMAG
jgi:hypothetical protein